MEGYQVFAPATVGNVGPGFDCLGLCIAGLGDQVQGVRADEVSIKRISGRQAEGLPTDPKKNTVSLAAMHYFRSVGYQGGMEISIERSLPLAGGLGASAASAVAGAMLAALMVGDPPKSLKVLESALFAEQQVAGRHLDNIAPCLYGGLVLIQGIDPIRTVQIPVQADWHYVLLSPQCELKTKNARACLPKSLPTKTWSQQNANTAAVLTAFMTDDAQLLRDSFEDLFAEPARAPLIPNFFDIKREALQAGALGCTISGGGPSILAIAQDEHRADKIAVAMKSASCDQSQLHMGKLCKVGAKAQALGQI